MPWGFAIGAVGAIASSAIGSSASSDAAQTQANSAQNATNAQLQMFNQTQQNLNPFIKSGTNALATLQSQIGIGANGAFNPNAPLVKPFTQADFQSSPGYGFQMSQGIDAIQNSASAAGGIKGGNTLKSLDTFGQGIANQDWWNAYNAYTQRQQQQYGMINNFVGSGQNAAAGLGAISANVGNQVGSNMIGAGNALAAGQVGSANATTGGLNSLAQIANLYGTSNQNFLSQNASGLGSNSDQYQLDPGTIPISAPQIGGIYG